MRANVNGIELRYDTQGEGPDVVLTHGMGGRLEVWDSVEKELAKSYRVTSWDVRGFGESSKPEGPVTPESWVADLLGLMDHIGIEKAVHVGHSMGGVIVQRFALDHPNRTRGLVPMGTSSEVNEKAQQRWARMADKIEKEGLQSVIGDRGSLAFSDAYNASHPAEVAEYTSQRLRNDGPAYAAAGRAVSSYNYTAELERLTCPTLVIAGGDDKVAPPGGSVIMSRKIPGAKLEIIENCGHTITMEQGPTFIALLKDFLASLD
jgi:3-oxoadipate enol-lactonase